MIVDFGLYIFSINFNSFSDPKVPVRPNILLYNLKYTQLVIKTEISALEELILKLCSFVKTDANRSE